jgi:hypothetical protein
MQVWLWWWHTWSLCVEQSCKVALTYSPIHPLEILKTDTRPSELVDGLASPESSVEILS